MATLPSASTTVSDTAGAVAQGLDTICVFAPVATNADNTPRLYGNANAIYTQHGYSEGLEYAALHFAKTRKPVLFVGLAIATAGVIGREDTTGNSGSCTTTVAAGGDGCLTEHDGVLTCVTGGTIGTDQIVLGLSLDGGTTTKTVRLGTGTSYTIPYIGVSISFGAGTLVAGDIVHTWHGTGPRSDATGWAAGRTALASQSRAFRTCLLTGDLQNATEGNAWATQWNTYETSNERFVRARASVLDREPDANVSQVTHSMTGSPNITFAEVGATGDTITRSAGSFVTDGFAVGDIITISGSTSNNMTTAAAITGVTATVLTLDDDDLADEGPVGGVSIVGEASLTFATDETITRSSGSWLDDGYRVGDSVVISGSASNDGTHVITTLTATVMTCSASTILAEVIGVTDLTMTAGQTKAVWMAAIDAAFETVDDEWRVDLSAGRGKVLSPLTGWWFRRPAGWAASLREYRHDLHIATWRKSDGPTDFDLYDSDGNLTEWDDYVDGGAATAARFTSFRTWANGPQGAFIARSLTRALDASLLSLSSNADVVNLIQTTIQLNAEEAAIGQDMILNTDGTATSDSLGRIESKVNAALELAVLTNRGEGPRASACYWTPADDDLYNVAEPVMNGTCEVTLNGKVHTVTTIVKINAGG